MLGYHRQVFNDYKGHCEMSGFTAEGKPDKKCTVEDIVADLKLTQSKLDV